MANEIESDQTSSSYIKRKSVSLDDDTDNDADVSFDGHLQFDEDSEQENNDPKRRCQRLYTKYMEYDSLENATNVIHKQLLGIEWTKRWTNETQEGEKIYFSCKGHPKCPKQIYILRHSDSLKTSIYICEADHAHVEGSLLFFN